MRRSRRFMSPQGLSRWPLAGLIAAGSLAVGGCAGALAGHFAVTGGLSPGAGWEVPRLGTDRAVAALPPATAGVRTAQAPQFAGYYPADDPAISTPAVADDAARDFDALYDAPDEPQAEPEPPAPPEPLAPDFYSGAGGD